MKHYVSESRTRQVNVLPKTAYLLRLPPTPIPHKMPNLASLSPEEHDVRSHLPTSPGYAGYSDAIARFNLLLVVRVLSKHNPVRMVWHPEPLITARHGHGEGLCG